jgi:glutamate/tyrosine decarboxylase-like PLP-dependent enzyme
MWLEALERAVAGLEAWEARWPGALVPAFDDAAGRALADLLARLDDNYPFFSPRYAGQMLKPPHPIAWAAYALTMLVNPNNHALDGGPATAAMEREVVAALAGMLGFPTSPQGHLGHLTAGGTMANLEALWICRELAPGRRIVYSEAAHYTHARMCAVLGVEGKPVPVDPRGRMDLEALARELEQGDVGAVVATPGTTGLGALDPLDGIVALARRHGARVHVDAAYGGFFALLAARAPPLVDRAPFRAIADADSVVIDPHKHGLQPYGCGCVLFRDPSVARFYAHDSPYTYFTSSERHLGEISLECSRPGAAAAALWTTLQAIPLEPERGLGEMLAAGRRAAQALAARIDESEHLRLLVDPDTDIVVFAPTPSSGARASELSRRAQSMLERAMARGGDSIYLATFSADRALVERAWPGLDISWDIDSLTLLRSVMMKGEHEAFVPTLAAALDELAVDL